jgi:hypothetical protein
MADEEIFDQTDEDDFDYEDLTPYDDVAEEEEKKSDELVMKLAKQQRKLAERQAKMEAQAARDKLIADFYAAAKDEEKELADVLLAGVTEPDKVQKLLDLAKAKASKLAPGDEEDEEKSVEEAFSAAPSVSPPEIIDKGKETAERTRKGDAGAAWLEFLAAPAKKGPIEAG